MKLDQNYKLYGDYRYGNMLKKIPFNENNNIITNKKVLENKTLWLPWIPNNFNDLKISIKKMSIMPRIATIIIFETDYQNRYCMINTHLDYQIPSIQIRQLEVLKTIIEKYSKEYSIFLTGDFNMEINNPIFIDFINNTKKIIQHVYIEENTWYDKNGQTASLDHIFIPNDWNVEQAGTIDSKKTSDHKIIYAKVLKKI